MNSELCPKAFEHLIKHMDVSVANPGVLVMDNHQSHISVEVVEMARENGLSIGSFAPHCSHRMQSLQHGRVRIRTSQTIFQCSV